MKLDSAPVSLLCVDTRSTAANCFEHTISDPQPLQLLAWRISASPLNWVYERLSSLKREPFFSHGFNRAAMSSGAESSDPSAAANGSEARKIEPIRMPTPEEIRGQDIWNNCAVRSVVSGVMGGGLGLVMGLFFGALDRPLMADEMTGKQHFIYQAKQMGQRSWSSCKAFAVMGLVFSAAECVIEQARAKHDTANTVFAGCVTGAAISAKGGPKAACAGCAGFAAFSVVIEKFLEGHS